VALEVAHRLICHRQAEGETAVVGAEMTTAVDEVVLREAVDTMVAEDGNVATVATIEGVIWIEADEILQEEAMADVTLVVVAAGDDDSNLLFNLVLDATLSMHR
jgi:hypothetical protein